MLAVIFRGEITLCLGLEDGRVLTNGKSKGEDFWVEGTEGEVM